MAQDPVIGYGATVEYSSDNGANYTPVNAVVDINGPDIKIPGAKATSQDSPSEAHEYIPKLIDPQPFTINCLHEKTTLTALYGLVRTVLTWRITLADVAATVWTCDGFISSIKDMVPLDDVMTTEFEIQWTSKPTLT